MAPTDPPAPTTSTASTTGSTSSSTTAVPADPAANGLHFTEVGKTAGLTETHSELALIGDEGMTSGAAVADVDGDGDLDIFIPRVGKPNSLYLNDGSGSFTDVAREAGVAGPARRHGSTAAVFFDADADGAMDLFVLGAGQGANQMFMNDGTGRFTEQTAERGLVWPDPSEVTNTQHHGVSVADVNGDGHLDLLVLQWYTAFLDPEALSMAGQAVGPAPSSEHGLCAIADVIRRAGFPVPPGSAPSRSGLWLNDGTGHFRDTTAEYGLPMNEIAAFTGVFADFDHDGWQDLMIIGDACTSRLFRNDNGRRFLDVTEAAGVGTDENGMGAVVRDVDGDGTPDVFITSIWRPDIEGCIACAGNRLFLNNGDATFIDGTDDFDLKAGYWGWGAAIEDFANDGRLAVVMNNGYDSDSDYRTGTDDGSSEPSPFFEDPTLFWVLDGGSYRDVAAAVGIDDTTIGHALIPFDMDLDGDLDLLIVPKNGAPLLYRNDTPARSWLTVSLADTTNAGNSWGDGARVEVVVDEGTSPVVGWITTTGSYESQKPPEFHVGFGDRSEPVHQVSVWWPQEQSPQVTTGVNLNQRLRIEREP